jgi:hypothetical protein
LRRGRRGHEARAPKPAHQAAAGQGIAYRHLLITVFPYPRSCHPIATLRTHSIPGRSHRENRPAPPLGRVSSDSADCSRVCGPVVR